MTTIEKFENYLNKIKPAQRMFIYLLPAFLAGAIIYLDILPMQEEELDTLTQRNEQLKHDIKRKSPLVLRRKIKKAEKKLLTLKTDVEEKRDDLNFLYAKLTNLEISEFNEKKWAVTLDKILKESLRHHITLKYIKNNNSEVKNPNDTVLPKKYVEITGEGNFKETLKYLSFIENTQFLIDIKNLRMEKIPENNKINFTINFTIYGVNL
jgi:Tfp pilus assembly protein PilO